MLKKFLEVHAGHGLTYKSAIDSCQKLINIVEFNIGHSIIAESIFIGLKIQLKNLKLLINKMKIFGIGTDIVNIKKNAKNIKN